MPPAPGTRWISVCPTDLLVDSWMCAISGRAKQFGMIQYYKDCKSRSTRAKLIALTVAVLCVRGGVVAWQFIEARVDVIHVTAQFDSAAAFTRRTRSPYSACRWGG